MFLKVVKLSESLKKGRAFSPVFDRALSSNRFSFLLEVFDVESYLAI